MGDARTGRTPVAGRLAAPAPARAGTREWAGLVILTLPLLVLSLDMSVLYLALPHLAAGLRATATQQLWIVDAYGFLIAGFLVTMGGLGDRTGRRRLLLAGAAAFAVLSVAAAFAPTAETLIVARSAMGVAGACLMPSTLSLITTMFRDPAQRVLAIGIWMTTFSLGLVLGGLVGGLLLDSFWWGSVFLVGVPVMLLLLVLGPVLLPERRDPDSSWIDPASVVLSLAAVLPVVYGVKRLAVDGPDVNGIVGVAVGAVAGVLFVRRQRRVPDPLVDLTLFRYPVFVAALAMMVLALVAENGILFLVPQFLQLVAGLTAWDAGMWLIPVAAITAVAALVTPALTRVVRPALLVPAGCAVSIGGLLVLTGLTPDSELVLVTVAVGLVVLGLAPVTVLGTDLVVSSVPPARAGSAAALSETSGELGVALGVAAMGSVVAAVHRRQTDVLDGSGLPQEVVAAARGSAHEAVAVSGTLPGPVGERVVALTREAFVDGVAAAGWLGALLLVIVASVSMVTLRGLPSRGAHVS